MQLSPRGYNFLFLMCLSVFLSACRGGELLRQTVRAPVMQATATSTPIAPQPPAAIEPNNDGKTMFVSAAGSFSLTMPVGWTIFPLTDEPSTDWLTRVMDESTLAGAAAAETHQLAEVLAADGASDLAAVAVYTGEAGNASLTIAVVARDGLSLQTYLKAVTGQLAQLEGVAVEEAGFRDDLLASQLPAAVILSTQGDPLTDTAGIVASYQVALFDARAEHIILLTFVTERAQFEKLQPHFAAVVQAVVID